MAGFDQRDLLARRRQQEYDQQRAHFQGQFRNSHPINKKVTSTFGLIVRIPVNMKSQIERIESKIILSKAAHKYFFS